MICAGLLVKFGVWGSVTFDSFLASTAGCFLLGIQSSRKGLGGLGLHGFWAFRNLGVFKGLKGFVSWALGVLGF